jgi:cyclopropane-fatty-acyl-phospholipid synthase
MSMHRQESVTRSVNSELSIKSVTETFLRRLVGDLERGELVIETPAGDRLVLGGKRPGPQAKLTIHSWRCLWRLVSGGDIGFAEAYCAGEWSSPNLVEFLKLACDNSAVMSPVMP